ncbi:MAG: hypothetical protein EA376_01430 [Phycisphaeraceae bacterium]|nr:MAG: hypothetical protein EA376_01430 [Phycisphaeraceae bacterium]
MLVGALSTAAGKLQTFGAFILIAGIAMCVIFVIAPAYTGVVDAEAPEFDERTVPLRYLYLSGAFSLAGAALYIAALVVGIRQKTRGR